MQHLMETNPSIGIQAKTGAQVIAHRRLVAWGGALPAIFASINPIITRALPAQPLHW